uniref:hypothetical protein n=1 Tax=Pseudomonas aeruginosa TaxID=287 RepID=UPI003CEC43EE
MAAIYPQSPPAEDMAGVFLSWRRPPASHAITGSKEGGFYAGTSATDADAGNEFCRPGMVFWHNDSWTIFRELEVFVRSKLKEYQYQEVKGPFMMDRVLWEKTGHWDNYKDAMFT